MKTTRVILRSGDNSTIKSDLANNLQARAMYIESINIPLVYYNIVEDTTISFQATNFSIHNLTVSAGDYSIDDFMIKLTNAMTANDTVVYSYQKLNTHQIRIFYTPVIGTIILQVNDPILAYMLGTDTGIHSSVGGELIFENSYNFERTGHILLRSNVNFGSSYTSYDNLLKIVNTDYDNIIFAYPVANAQAALLNQYFGNYSTTSCIATLPNRIEIELVDEYLRHIDLHGVYWSISIIFIL